MSVEESDRARGRAFVSGLVEHSRRRIDDTRAWAEDARGRSAAVSVAFEVAERDRERLGGLLAGAVAFRLFLWLLPFALMLVGLLGALTQFEGSLVTEATDEVGLQGVLTQVIADGARQSGWWIAILIGLMGTAYAGLGVARALRISHAAAWGVPPRRAGSVARASLTVTAIALGLLAVSVLIGWLRERSGLAGLLAALVIIAIYFTIWLRISVHLPRRPTPVRALVPGALLVALGAQGLHLFTAYYLAGQAERVASVYGTIGMALTLLLWLFILARLMVASAIVNAALWEREQDRQRGRRGRPPGAREGAGDHQGES